MSGIDYLIDTNFAVYYLEGNPVTAPFKDYTLAISSITEMELLSKKGMSHEEMEEIKNFIRNCIIIEINNTIKENTISLRQNYRAKLPDAIIAGTALYLDITLITADTGFNNLTRSGLKLAIIYP